MPLHQQVTGAGQAVVFVHAGIADGRMWDPQWSSLAGRFRLVRCDLAGFGQTPIDRLPLTPAADVAGLLDSLAISGAAVVGSSMGGRVALEVAVARPDLVGALVLADAGLPDFEWSSEVRAFGRAEDEAMSRGDLDAATEVNVRMWVDGPRRAPAEVDAAIRDAVTRMQRRAFELQAPRWTELDEEPLVPTVADRLGELTIPTLVLDGELDVEDFRAIADLLATRIPGARRATIAGAAHLPSLERPAVFDALLVEFLDRWATGPDGAEAPPR